MGLGTKSNNEVCLRAVKGKPQIISNKVSSAVITSVTDHSRKPNIVRDRIVQLCGDVHVLNSLPEILRMVGTHSGTTHDLVINHWRPHFEIKKHLSIKDGNQEHYPSYRNDPERLPRVSNTRL